MQVSRKTRYFGFLPQCVEDAFLESSLHHAQAVYYCEGEPRRYGRPKSVLASGEDACRETHGPLSVVWGSNDAAVADLVGVSPGVVCYVSSNEPGKKVKSKLAAMEKVGRQVLCLAPLEEAHRVILSESGPVLQKVGTVDGLPGFVEVQAEPKKKATRKKTKAAPEPAPVEEVSEEAGNG